MTNNIPIGRIKFSQSSIKDRMRNGKSIYSGGGFVIPVFWGRDGKLRAAGNRRLAANILAGQSRCKVHYLNGRAKHRARRRSYGAGNRVKVRGRGGWVST